MTSPRWPNALLRFYANVQEVFGGRHPRLCKAERMWLYTFREVAARFACLTEEESFDLSIEALRRCYARRTARYYKYLRRACLNAHIDYLRKMGFRSRRLTTDPTFEEDWETVDGLIDLEDCLRKLGGLCEKAMRLRLREYKMEDIAAELGVSERHANRLVANATQHLRERLGESYADPVQLPGL